MPQEITLRGITPCTRRCSPGCEIARCARVAITVIAGVVVHGRGQPSGPAHRGAVKGIDDAADEAYLVGLVGLAIHPGMRPGKVMPAAHFDKAL